MRQIYTPPGSAAAGLQSFDKPPPSEEESCMLTRPIEEVIKSLQLPDSLRNSGDFMLFHFAKARRIRGRPDIIFPEHVSFPPP